jgi:hypothetical protein
MVFDIKRNGMFCARLVGCGYSQVPGVDFQESNSPVINDGILDFNSVPDRMGINSSIDRC